MKVLFAKGRSLVLEEGSSIEGHMAGLEKDRSQDKKQD